MTAFQKYLSVVKNTEKNPSDDGNNGETVQVVRRKSSGPAADRPIDPRSCRALYADVSHFLDDVSACASSINH